MIQALSLPHDRGDSPPPYQISDLRSSRARVLCLPGGGLFSNLLSTTLGVLARTEPWDSGKGGPASDTGTLTVLGNCG